jgi:hypothetical protein
MYSKGVSWIDDVRIPHNEECKEMKKQDVINSIYGQGGRHADVLELKPQGRFPANILVCDDMLNDGVITLSQGGNSTHIGGTILKIPTDESKRGKKSGFGDKGSNSRYYDIDKWFNNLIDG